MRLDVRHVNIPVSDALQEFTQRRVERALRPFLASVRRVDVRIGDVNGPRGGVDMRCTMTAEVAATRRNVVVRSKAADAYAAVHLASGSLGEAVSRVLTRRRRVDRMLAAPGPRDDGAPAPVSTPLPARADCRIQVTAVDHERLQRLIDSWPDSRDRSAVEGLADELDRADVIAQDHIAPSVVTMNSTIAFQDDATGETREVSLVYPDASDPELGRVSVLAPIGSALLGLSVGQTIDWPLPGGETKRLRIIRVIYQPEEAGHLHL
jgi:regulator of nucleoside diphosphate kinase